MDSPQNADTVLFSAEAAGVKGHTETGQVTGQQQGMVYVQVYVQALKTTVPMSLSCVFFLNELTLLHHYRHHQEREQNRHGLVSEVDSAGSTPPLSITGEEMETFSGLWGRHFPLWTRRKSP